MDLYLSTQADHSMNVRERFVCFFRASVSGLAREACGTLFFHIESGEGDNGYSGPLPKSGGHCPLTSQCRRPWLWQFLSQSFPWRAASAILSKTGLHLFFDWSARRFEPSRYELFVVDADCWWLCSITDCYNSQVLTTLSYRLPFKSIVATVINVRYPICELI